VLLVSINPLEILQYGCRRITAWLRRSGWYLNHRHAERIWHPSWLRRLDMQSLFNEPGSSCEYDQYESLNVDIYPEILNNEISFNLNEAKTLVE
jgi:hypothetical protein